MHDDRLGVVQKLVGEQSPIGRSRVDQVTSFTAFDGFRGDVAGHAGTTTEYTYAKFHST